MKIKWNDKCDVFNIISLQLSIKIIDFIIGLDSA